MQRKMCYSGNDIVDAILHYELSRSCDARVTVNIYGNLPNISTVSKIDMCTLFSNMLSNAIASANQCVGTMNGKITIKFSSGGKYFSICIINSVKDTGNVIVKNRKDRNHGHGVGKIKGVLDKYDGRVEQSLEQGALTIAVYLPI